jgi:hypothetical protein
LNTLSSVADPLAAAWVAKRRLAFERIPNGASSCF